MKEVFVTISPQPKTADMNQNQRREIANYILDDIKEFYADPENERKFNEWKAKRLKESVTV